MERPNLIIAYKSTQSDHKGFDRVPERTSYEIFIRFTRILEAEEKIGIINIWMK